MKAINAGGGGGGETGRGGEGTSIFKDEKERMDEITL